MTPDSGQIGSIRSLIAEGKLEDALEQARSLLQSSPALDEALRQSGRFEEIRNHIRLEMTDRNKDSLSPDQIRAGLLELLRGMEEQGKNTEISKQSAETEAGIQRIQTASKIYNIGHIENAHFHAEYKIPQALSPLPFLPEVFLGREAELEAIHHQLTAEDPGDHLLLLSGMGGMGKSALAAHFYHRFRMDYGHVAWILSQKNIRNALLLLAGTLGLKFEEQMPSDQRFLEVLRTLSALPGPCLLVIDNVNEVDDLRDNYQDLRRLSNFHILITTRITEFGKAKCFSIQSLPVSSALELFKQYYPKSTVEEEALFGQIHEAIGGNTLVMEVLAKNLARINRLKTQYTLANLLSDLQQKGLLGLSQSKEIETDYHSSEGKMRQEKPEDILIAMYELVDLPTEEIRLLSVFAVLPTESIPFTALEILLPEEPDGLEDPLLSLAQKGWLEYNQSDMAFKGSPVVQDILRQKNPALRTDCKTLVERLIELLKHDGGTGHLLNASYDEGQRYARYAESVVGAFEEGDDRISLLCQRLGAYHQTTGDLSRAQSIFEVDLSINKKLHDSAPQNPDYSFGLAISNQRLGMIQLSLGNPDKAITYFEEFSRLSKDLHETAPEKMEFHFALGISMQFLGLTHRALGDLDKALACFEEDFRIGKMLLEAAPENVEFKKGLASSYSKLGESHTALGNPEKALTLFEENNRLIKELYDASPQDVDIQHTYSITPEFDSLSPKFFKKSRFQRFEAYLFSEKHKA